MKKQNIVPILLAALFVIAGSVIAGSGRATTSEIPAPPAIGTAIEDFTLPDVDGKDHALNSLKGKNFYRGPVPCLQRLQRAHGETCAGL
jgi:cytochrome oxidase Cu insertion factor (SCO1/SenC/PrrC family)